MVKKYKISYKGCKNLTAALRRHLPHSTFKAVKTIGSLADKSGLSAYIVGGFVRDMLLEVANLDLDIVVEGNALELARDVQQKIDIVVQPHRRFGTATLIFPKNNKLDIATARREEYSRPAALPKVSFSTMEDDLFRRDFTINALAIKINRSNFGALCDLFDGIKDLEAGKIRVMHDQSFIDDPTRILRAVRFEQRFNFSIERSTEKLIKEAMKTQMLHKLSRFRIGDETILILKERDPLKSLRRLSKLCRGLEFIHPAIRLNRTMLMQLTDAQQLVHWFEKQFPQRPFSAWLVYFIILTSQLNLGQTKKLCRDFCLTRKDVQKLISFKTQTQHLMRTIAKGGTYRRSQIFWMLKPFSDEELLAILSVSQKRLIRRRINIFLKTLSAVKITLTGKDLQRFKIKPGPEYKDILQKTLSAKIDGQLKSRADELYFVRRLIKRDI